MAYSDRQTDERWDQNLREKEEEKKNETYREMVILLKWNLNTEFSIYTFFSFYIIKYSNVI